MPIQQLPPRPLPPGERPYMDVVREIEASENLVSTGFHFHGEPPPEYIDRIARVHLLCDPSLVTARRIDYGKAGCDDWTVFRVRDGS